MARRSKWGRTVDEWFPRIVRYLGLVLLVYAVLVDRFDNPSLLPSAIAMIFFKNVYQSGGGE